MTNIKTYDGDVEKQRIHYLLQRAFQSANINLLIGSGASYPAIKLVGNIEKEINDLLEADKEQEAKEKKCTFVQTIQTPTNQLIKDEKMDDNDKVKSYYTELLNILMTILIKRKTKLLPIQATIFTTNYDLFIEKSFENLPFQSLRLNDGFGRFPSLKNKFEFSPENFFETTSSRGQLYDYKVEIPSINLIKLHGSMSWKREEKIILYRVEPTDELPVTPSEDEQTTYLDQFTVVLPQKHKFRETVLDRFYYDLLRTYANQLDEKNTLLIVFGFSFTDEHIREITKRALKNPTLKIIIFAFDLDSALFFENEFKKYNNVDIVQPADGATIGFEIFNTILKESSGTSSNEM